MSFEDNKDDFEKALEGMKKSIEALEPSVDEVILEPLYAVINEYEGHYSRDIEVLITERDNLQEKVDEQEI